MCSGDNIRTPNLLSFKRVPWPPWCFGEYFHPIFINLKGITFFRTASLSQAMSEDLKSYFKCSSWIFTVKCNAHGFSQYYNFQNKTITMLEDIGYIAEMTAWHLYQGDMSDACVWWGGNRFNFFRLTHGAKFGKVNKPLTSLFRGSILYTGQTSAGWILVLVHQWHANHASLGTPNMHGHCEEGHFSPLKKKSC